MNTTGLLKGTSQKQQSRISLATAKKLGLQTPKIASILLETPFAASIENAVLCKSNPFADGFVLDGYFLGTFEFDSLTGHPGIRY